MPDHDAIMEAKLKMIDETHRFVPKRSALLIIDMQHGFVDEGASLEVAAAREEARRRAASSRRFAEEAIRRGLARPLYMEEALFRARQVTTLTLLRSEALASLECRQAASARLRSAQR